MKRATIISLSAILAIGIGIAAFIGINMKETIKLESNAEFAIYDLQLSSDWSNPEPRENSNANPIGQDDTAAYWVNSDGCVITRWLLQLDPISIPDNDYDATLGVAFGKRPTVLNAINSSSRISIFLSDEDKMLETIASQYEDSLGMYFTAEEYKIYQLSRTFADSGNALLVFVGCPKESNIDPLTLASEVVLAKAS